VLASIDNFLRSWGAIQLPIDLLRPFPAGEMRAWKVSAAGGNLKNNFPELRLPVD
jgi:putative SOS response-associated peptidase YedK